MRERAGAVKHSTKISTDIQSIIAPAAKVIFAADQSASMNSVRLRRAAVVKVSARVRRMC
jgi:hypothetical protein